MNTINTDVAISLANLSKKSLEEFCGFLNDFIHYSTRSNFYKQLSNKNYFSIDEFVAFCQSKFGYSDKKINSNEKKMYYRDLVRAYPNLLKEIMQSDEAFKNLYYEGIKKNINDYVDFVSYLYNNQIDKEVILKNLEEIKKIGINEFIFNPKESLDNVYTAKILENSLESRNNEKRYFVSSICSDGDKNWLNQTDEKYYPFTVKGAKYIIEYTKGSLFQDKVAMIVKDFNFDTETLPSVELLRDTSVLPDIDYDIINSKTRAVDITYALEEAMERGNLLQDSIQYLFRTLKNYGYDEEGDKILNELSSVGGVNSYLHLLKDRFNEIILSDENISMLSVKEAVSKKRELKRR